MTKKNIIKIIVAVVVILLIIIATFAYGDSQRKAQVKKGQVTSTSTQENAQSASNQTPAQTTPPASKPSPAPVNGKTPQTGPELLYSLPIIIISLLYFYNRDQRRARLK